MASHMTEALAQAEIALATKEIPVGCVVVRRDTDEIIARGYNQTNVSRNGTRHAEMVAVEDVCVKQGLGAAVFLECDLYVTCEPCIMCSAALARLGIKKVYFGCANDKFGGNGSVLSVHSDDRLGGDYRRYEVSSGLMEKEAIKLFQKFYSGENMRAPEEKRKTRRKRGEESEEDEGRKK